MNIPGFEEGYHVGNISFEEVLCERVFKKYCLSDINDVGFLTVVKNVIWAKITMDDICFLVHGFNEGKYFVAGLLGIFWYDVFEEWCSGVFGSNILHDEYVADSMYGFRCAYMYVLEALKIFVFFFGPFMDDGASRVSGDAESWVTFDIFGDVFEGEI